jgi:hypothetical protein
LIEQPGQLGIGQMNLVERFEFFAEVFFERVPVANVGAVAVFEILEFIDQAELDPGFCCHAYNNTYI